MFIKKITQYEYPNGMRYCKITKSTVYFFGLPVYRSIKMPCNKEMQKLHEANIKIELAL